MRQVVFIAVFCIGLADNPPAQVIDYVSGFKSKSDRMFRLHVDNDYFTTTDRYYTYGITLELSHPVFKASPLNRLFLKQRRATYKYGVALAYFCYTPASLSNNDIRYGDRPFSGNLALSNFLSARDSLRGSMLSTSITLGIIGQGAGGKESQQLVHRITNNVDPCGWQYQIQNDLIVTYQVNYEKRLTRPSEKAQLNFCSEARFGTHTDKLRAGLSFMAGRYADPYGSIRRTLTRRKAYGYFYGQVQPALVLYDATLQGGMFNRNNPYVIASSAIRRITLQADYGIVLVLGKWYLEYCQSYLTPEFNGGSSHRWGGVRIGIDL